MAGKRPTHELKVKDTETGDSGKIGVAWANDDGSFSIRLEPCTVISYEAMRGKVMTLFPIKTEKEWEEFRSRKGADRRKTADDGSGDPQA